MVLLLLLLILSPLTVGCSSRAHVCRFYIPSHTWFLQVNVSNCRMLEHTFSHSSRERVFRWCVRSLALQARSLPIYTPESGVANITQGEGHVFKEKRPYADAYYYILVDTEGETGLDITIETRGELTVFIIQSLPSWKLRSKLLI